MKLLVVLALGLVGSVVAQLGPIELNYHTAVGIPEAARIKAAEETLKGMSPRIAGGLPAKLGNYPYFGGLIISLTDSMFISVCGSTLLTNTRAVTAAHCWRSGGSQAFKFEVVLGSTRLFSGGTRVITTDVEVHANYDQNTLANDIAIIRFGWISYNDNIRNIGLASGTNQFLGTWAQAIGFGRTGKFDITDKQFLSHVDLKIISSAECSLAYSFVPHSTICAASTGGRTVCGGDSGGPLVANNQLIGVTSFGCALRCPCAQPSGFSRVTDFNAWISARL